MACLRPALKTLARPGGLKRPPHSRRLWRLYVGRQPARSAHLSTVDDAADVGDEAAHEAAPSHFGGNPFPDVRFNLSRHEVHKLLLFVREMEHDRW